MRKFLIAFTITFVLGLMAIAGLVAFVDPFYHYHDATKGFEANMDNAIYQTPGAADHFTYDSVIVGSSMTENFHESWFGEMGLNMQKLSYSGAEMDDYVTILNRAFDSGNEIKLVVTDINEFQLTSQPGKVYQERPSYLYDDKWYTDTQYLYNNDVFWITTGKMLERMTGNQPTKDNSYTWEEPDLFSEENARKDYALFEEQLNKEIAEGTHTLPSHDELVSNAEANTDMYLKVIKEHPDTTFIIFYPPFSKLYWDEAIANDNLEDVLAVFEISMVKFAQCDNVMVYYFQDEEDIITDLDRYRDVGHYEPAVNRYIFDVIKADYQGECDECKERITKENLESHIEAMREIALR